LQTFSLDIARLNLPCTTGYARSSIQRRFSVWALHLRLKKREAKECLERLTNNGSCDVEPDNPSHASRRLPAWKRKLPNRVRVGTCLTFVLLFTERPRRPLFQRRLYSGNQLVRCRAGKDIVRACPSKCAYQGSRVGSVQVCNFACVQR
jgi:hypothetical protein